MLTNKSADAAVKDAVKPIKTVEYDKRKEFLFYLPKNAVCAELGCEKAKLSRWILKITDPKRLFIVDPYWKAYGDKFDWNGADTRDCFRWAIDRIRAYENSGCVTFVIEYDTVFLADYPDNFFDWIYLDTTHNYKDTLKELPLMKAKIKDDGLLCGDDYYTRRHPGVTVAICEWLKQNTDYELYLIDNHGQWIIRKKAQK